MYTPIFGQRILYGADYNPEQWLDYPDILEKDVELMKQAHCNIMSVGIFSWAKLEPQEGQFDFKWLDQVLDRLHAHGVSVFLATPTGAKPAWMAQKYPETLRVNDSRVRAMFGARHNHCMTSPVYREKTRIINEKLAERYSNHPAVIGWHLSNEYGGACHCPLCQQEFRKFLKEKYGTLDFLNHSWWNTFWSHTITDWNQIESPSPIGEMAVHGLNIDWMRFTSRNALDFCKLERDVVKSINPKLPVTANFMEFFRDYDYFEWAKELDFISWDSYPQWHVFEDPLHIASYAAMNHDLMRSLKGGQPFMLMESTPSCTNWRPLSTLKRPGMNILSSLQAVAHGADSVQYFQWRKSRGSSEKFHGAIVDHVGHLDTRVGREVVELGSILEKLSPVAGSDVRAKVALILDTQNRWALEDAQGPRNKGIHYIETCLDYYRPFFERGISVDVIDETMPLDKYDLVLAPLTYMLRPNYAEKVASFVEKGGTYVASCWSGIVNETDLCFLGGFPGPLKHVMGVWEEDIDSYEDGITVEVKVNKGFEDFNNASGASLCGGSYKAREICAYAHAEGDAKVLCSYVTDEGHFLNGSPVLIKNDFGKGHTYYVAARMDANFLNDLCSMLVREIGLTNAFGELGLRTLGDGISASVRFTDKEEYVFIGNYNKKTSSCTIPHEYEAIVGDLAGSAVSGKLTLKPYGSMVLKRPAKAK